MFFFFASYLSHRVAWRWRTRICHRDQVPNWVKRNKGISVKSSILKFFKVSANLGRCQMHVVNIMVKDSPMFLLGKLLLRNVCCLIPHSTETKRRLRRKKRGGMCPHVCLWTIILSIASEILINCYLTSKGKLKKATKEGRNVIYDPSSWCLCGPHAVCRLETFPCINDNDLKLNFHPTTRKTFDGTQVENRKILFRRIKIFCWLKIQFCSFVFLISSPARKTFHFRREEKIVFHWDTCYETLCSLFATWKLNKTRWETLSTIFISQIGIILGKSSALGRTCVWVRLRAPSSSPTFTYLFL